MARRAALKCLDTRKRTLHRLKQANLPALDTIADKCLPLDTMPCTRHLQQAPIIRCWLQQRTRTNSTNNIKQQQLLLVTQQPRNKTLAYLHNYSKLALLAALWLLQLLPEVEHNNNSNNKVTNNNRSSRETLEPSWRAWRQRRHKTPLTKWLRRLKRQANNNYYNNNNSTNTNTKTLKPHNKLCSSSTRTSTRSP